MRVVSELAHVICAFEPADACVHENVIVPFPTLRAIVVVLVELKRPDGELPKPPGFEFKHVPC